MSGEGDRRRQGSGRPARSLMLREDRGDGG